MDPVAAIRPYPIDVQLGPWIYTIPELSAADWLEAVVSRDPGAIVPGLMDEATQRDVWRCVLRGEITPDEINEGWRYALGAAVGQPWWSAARLLLSAAHRDAWPVIHGRLSLRGVDLERVSIGALWNAIYYIGLEGCNDQTERAKFEFDLAQAPPGVSAAEAFDGIDAAADFLAAADMLRKFDGGVTPDPLGGQ